MTHWIQTASHFVDYCAGLTNADTDIPAARLHHSIREQFITFLPSLSIKRSLLAAVARRIFSFFKFPPVLKINYRLFSPYSLLFLPLHASFQFPVGG